MVQSHAWTGLLTDRMFATPAVNWLLPQPFRLSFAGQRYALGRRHLELFALIGRSVKRGRSLVLFLPPRDPVDLLAAAVYCHLVRIAVQAGVSAPGVWMNTERIGEVRDVMIAGTRPEFRARLMQDVQLSGESLERHFQIAWPCARRGRLKSDVLERRGKHMGPAICLLGQRASRLEWLEDIRPETHPFVVLVEAGESPEQAMKAAANFLQTFAGVPLIMLAPLGHKGTLLAARDQKLPIWIARAGDIVRLDKGEDAAGLYRLKPSGVPTRLTQTCERLCNGIRVRVMLVKDETMEAALNAAVTAAQAIASEDSATSPLLQQVKALVRWLAGLAVPLTVYEEAVSTSLRAGPYAPTSLLRRCEGVRTTPAASGRAESARQAFLAAIDTVLGKLNKRSACCAKWAAIVKLVRDAQANNTPLAILCTNEAMETALQSALGIAGIDALGEHQPVQVMTRSRAWRTLDAAASEGAVVLLGGLDFGSGIFFSGLSREIVLLGYGFEEQTILKQLEHIAHDTQRVSAPLGDKWRLVTGSKGPIVDRDVDYNESARWQIEVEQLSVAGVYLDELQPPQNLNPIDPDWLTECLEAHEETSVIDDADAAGRTTRGRLRIVLDDGEDDLFVLPTTRILVVDAVEKTGEGEIAANDLVPGMTIIALRTDPSRSLFEAMAERLEANPEYVRAQSMLAQWRQAVTAVSRLADGSAQAAFEMLRHHGVRVGSSQAVGYWLKGTVIGPDDPRSVLAVAKVAGRTDLEQNYRIVHGAAKQIATWRRSLGRNLAKAVRDGLGLGPDRLVDRELGLYSSDLEELTRIATVVVVESVGREAGR